MAKHSSVTLKSTRGRFLPLSRRCSLPKSREFVFNRGSRDGNEESAQTRKATRRKKSRRSPSSSWPRGDDRWTIVNADDILPGQGRCSFPIPNYIRDVSTKVTRRTILAPRSTETRRFFYIFGILRPSLSSSDGRGT